MPDKITVFGPATIANVGCGVDIFGISLKTPGDSVTISKTENPTTVISKISGIDDNLPYDSKKNTVSIGINAMIDTLPKKLDFGFSIELEKNMPLKSGMGSSAASSAAGLLAANILLGNPYSKQDLIKFALKSEEIACGSAHADNVSPAILGGFCVVTSYSPLKVLKFEMFEDITILIIHPDIDVPTRASRKVVKNTLSLQKHIKQTGHIATAIAGIAQRNQDLFFEGIRDEILEPARSLLIPNYQEMIAILNSYNSNAANISGSGPSIFSFFKDRNNAEKASKEIEALFLSQEIPVKFFITTACNEGAHIIEN